MQLHRSLPHAVGGPRCALADCNGVDYTNSIVRDILLAGIYDVEICRDILSDPSMATRPINDIISVIESKESARDAVSSPAPRAPAPEAAAASSSFKSAGKQPPAAAPPRAPKPQVLKNCQQDPSRGSAPMLPGATPRRLRCVRACVRAASTTWTSPSTSPGNGTRLLTLAARLATCTISPQGRSIQSTIPTTQIRIRRRSPPQLWRRPGAPSAVIHA